MGNITVRGQTGGTQPARSEWDPLGWARDLLRWDPFREMTAFPTMPSDMAGFSPAFEVKETKDAYVFKADLPGIVEKELDIQRTGNRLTVSGKRESEKEDQGDTYYMMERSYGSFTRSFTLPDGVDFEHVGADLKNGVLSIVVPKMPEAQPQKISVTAPEHKA